MTRIARLWLAFVLAVTLPFHSAYAVTMSQCMDRAQPSTHAEQAVAHDHHASAGCEHATDGADRGAAPDGDDGSLGGSHCGACSACGTSTAITGPVVPVFLGTDYVAAPPVPEQRLQGVTPSRLDRPPPIL